MFLFAGAALSIPVQFVFAATTTCPTGPTVLINALGTNACDLNTVIGMVINVALGFAGAISLLMFILGGVQMLVSGGNAEMVKKGKATLTWAALGIVVIFCSYVLVNALISVLSTV